MVVDVFFNDSSICGFVGCVEDDFLASTVAENSSSKYLFSTIAPTSVGSNHMILTHKSSTYLSAAIFGSRYRLSGFVEGGQVEDATDVVAVGQQLATFKQFDNDTAIYGNGIEHVTDNTKTVTGTSTFNIGSSFTGVSSFFVGGIQEVIIYASDESANRIVIEKNINNHYGIY